MESDCRWTHCTHQGTCIEGIDTIDEGQSTVFVGYAITDAKGFGSANNFLGIHVLKSITSP